MCHYALEQMQDTKDKRNEIAMQLWEASPEVHEKRQLDLAVIRS